MPGWDIHLEAARLAAARLQAADVLSELQLEAMAWRTGAQAGATISLWRRQRLCTWPTQYRDTPSCCVSEQQHPTKDG